MNMSSDTQILHVLGSLHPLRLDRFDDGLCPQKLAFLIQEVGGRGDFMYYWYIRGPYSPAFTRTLFSERESQSLKDSPGLSDGERTLAGKVRSLVHGKTGDPLKLELYASAWYLAPKRRLFKRDRESIIETMRCTKPYFKKERVARVLAEIEPFRKGRAA